MDGARSADDTNERRLRESPKRARRTTSPGSAAPQRSHGNRWWIAAGTPGAGHGAPACDRRGGCGGCNLTRADSFRRPDAGNSCLSRWHAAQPGNRLDWCLSSGVRHLRRRRPRAHRPAPRHLAHATRAPSHLRAARLRPARGARSCARRHARGHDAPRTRRLDPAHRTPRCCSSARRSPCRATASGSSSSSPSDGARRERSRS